MLRLFPPPAVDVELDDAYRAARRAPEGRPWVAVDMVASVDGGTSADGVSGPLSSPADRQVFHTLRAVADMVLVGSSTAAAERYGPVASDPETRARRRHLAHWPLARIAVVSNRLDLGWHGRLFGGDGPRPFVVTSRGADPSAVATAREHAEVVVTPGDRVDLGAALAHFDGLGARVVLCEGGPVLNGELLAAGLVDELCLTLAPMLVGGASRPIVAGGPFPTPTHLELAHVLVAEGSLFLRYLRREELR